MQVILASVFINVFALVSAFYISIVYDRVIPNNAVETLIALTIGMLIVVVFDFVIKALRGIYTDHAGTLIDLEVSEALFERISRNEELMARKTGATASVVREFDTLKEFIASVSFVAFVDMPFIILFLAVLFAIGGPIALVPMLVVVMVVGFGVVVQPLVRRLTVSASKNGQGKQSVIVELLTGMETLQSLPGIGILRRRWLESVHHQGTTTARSRFWSQLTVNVSQSGQQLSQVGIIVYGVYLISGGELSMGTLIACVILSGRTLSPLGQVSQLLGRFNQALEAYGNLGSLMQEPVRESGRYRQLRIKEIAGGVQLRNVSFTYPGQKRPAIQQVSLSIAPGEKVAVVGKIGSGKTTLLRLIAGLYDAVEGEVHLDGTDVTHMHPDDLRRHVGVVGQSPMLFSGTLRENLLMGNPDASDEGIRRAAAVAGVDEVAAGLPDGYETVLAERGQQLSGGQRQAVTIARALMGNPAILVMDEPSSAMDNMHELQLLERLRERLRGVTLILITHRGALLELVDRVVVFEKGRVVMDGPKEQFIKAAGAAAPQPPREGASRPTLKTLEP